MEIPDFIHDWYLENSKKLAMPTSALINFALKTYIDQQKAAVNIEEVIKEIEDLKKLPIEKE